MIFHVCVCSMGLLGEFLLALNGAFQESDTAEVIGILDHLSRTSRFNLSVDFLGQKEKQAVRFCHDDYLMV